jgi:hypothetical protein
MIMTRNWPVIIASILCIGFIVGVWVNSYRVSHATPPIASIR